MPIPAVNVTIQDGALGAVPPNVSKVCVKFGICSKATASVAASLFVGSTTSPDGVTFTAVTPGAGGDAISITYTTGASSSPVVTVVGNAINVQIKAGTTTNANVVSAVAASAPAAALVTGVATGGSDLAIAASQAFLSGGVTGTIDTMISETNPTQVVSDLGYGPLSEAVVHSLNVAGGQVYAMPLNPSVAGSNSAFFHFGTGVPAISVSGTPNDSYAVQILITAGGALGVGQFQISQDGGKTFGAVFLIPSGGTYVIPNTGLTLTFASGTYVKNDLYGFFSSAPGFTITDVQNGWAAMIASGIKFGFTHLVGMGSSVSASASMAAALETLALSAASVNFIYTHADMECAQDTDANILSAFASTVCTRVMVCAGQAVVSSGIPGSGDITRNVGFMVAAREALVPEEQDLGAVADGPLPGVISLLRDESVTPNLDAANFTTCRTWTDIRGFFITNGHMFENPGSDFVPSQNRRVMDLACTIAYPATVKFINAKLRLNANGGTLTDQQAAAIQDSVNASLRAGVVAPGHAISSSVVVDKTNNVYASRTINETVRIQPFGYAHTINENIGFTNPTLGQGS